MYDSSNVSSKLSFSQINETNYDFRDFFDEIDINLNYIFFSQISIILNYEI